MRRQALLLSAVLVIAAFCTPPVLAATGLEFMDSRPIVIDLERFSAGERWAVLVFNGQSEGKHVLNLSVLFEPADVVSVANPIAADVAAGTAHTFEIRLNEKKEGVGELILTSSNGNLARRRISVVSGQNAEFDVGTLSFSGTRPSPFSRHARIEGIAVANAPGSTAGRRWLATLTSDRGHVARLIREGDTFEVVGADAPGEYTGKVKLAPPDGEETIVKAQVRDAFGWPLLVLVLGLAIVNRLEHYQRLTRRRAQLAIRLGALLDQAEAIQKSVGDRLRIRKRGKEQDLLLDEKVRTALESWDRAREESEWTTWEAGGDSYRGLADLIVSFSSAAAQYNNLDDKYHKVLSDVLSQDGAAVKEALDKSRVGEALRPTLLDSEEDLKSLSKRIELGTTHLDLFQEVYAQLRRMIEAGDRQSKKAAEDLKAKLILLPENLEPVSKETQELIKSWKPKVGQPPAKVTILEEVKGDSGPAVPPEVEEVALPSKPTARRSPRGGPRWKTAAAVVAALALMSVIAISGPWFMASDDPSAEFPGVAPSPLPTVLPPAPTNDALPPLVFLEEESPDSSLLVAMQGIVLPLLLVVVALLLGHIAVKLWRKRAQQENALNVRLLTKRFAQRETRFSLATGFIVIATGMSLLYLPHPTFGTVSDYLKVALWGTTVGEGLQLARRFLPGLKS